MSANFSATGNSSLNPQMTVIPQNNVVIGAVTDPGSSVTMKTILLNNFTGGPQTNILVRPAQVGNGMRSQNLIVVTLPPAVKSENGVKVEQKSVLLRNVKVKTEEKVKLKMSEHFKSIYEEYIKRNHGVFTCNVCDKTFAMKKLLQKHRKYLHNLRYLHSGNDAKSTETASTTNLASESSTISGKSKDGGESEGVDEQSGNDSSAESEPGNGTVGQFVHCDHCGKVYSKRMIHLHELFVHKLKLTVCEVCGLQGLIGQKLFYHMLTHYEDMPHKCDVCGDRFPSQQRLCLHMASHTGGKRFVCEEELCGKKYSCKGSLRKHVQSEHKISKVKHFTCRVCKREFDSKKSLNLHVDVKHPVVKPYACAHCNKKFSNSTRLNRHLLLHQERTHECKVCNKKFAAESALKTHSIVHSGEKTHLCDVCSKAFRMRHQLNTHMKSHEGDRPFKCDFCGNSFLLKHHLGQHMATHKFGQRQKVKTRSKKKD